MTSKDLPSDYVRVHNHGFVGLQDFMGSDAAIVQAARTSYAKETQITRDDAGLINYLMRKRHTSPFEMAEMKFHIRAPIFVLRQLVRHRTANLNEESGRYSVMEDDYFIPETSAVTGQSTTNKQMSGGKLDIGVQTSAKTLISTAGLAAFETYQFLLNSGVAREMARVVLPLGTYSTVVWKCDLHNLLHMLHLRLDEHAQQEIRDYAEVIFNFVKQKFPVTVAAWENYVRNAMSFSVSEQKILRALLPSLSLTADEIKSMVKEKADGLEITNREINEFLTKLERIKNGS